jgi:hypothetical protein
MNASRLLLSTISQLSKMTNIGNVEYVAQQSSQSREANHKLVCEENLCLPVSIIFS